MAVHPLAQSFAGVADAYERGRLLASAGELIRAGETPAELPVHVSIGLAFASCGIAAQPGGVA